MIPTLLAILQIILVGLALSDGPPAGVGGYPALLVIVTMLLWAHLADIAATRDRHRYWGGLALLGPVGVAIAYALPYRRASHRPGFPVVFPGEGNR